jgi:hypothetical protein
MTGGGASGRNMGDGTNHKDVENFCRHYLIRALPESYNRFQLCSYLCWVMRNMSGLENKSDTLAG